ncbi:hypothetical protein SALBM311S_08440 [Streptomyces alboniger]
MDLLLEAPAHPVQVFLFDADLALPHGVLCGFLDRVLCGDANGGFLLSLSGHPAPF